MTGNPTSPLRVLLFSPVAGVDPASGDTTYTEALLTEPPPGVQYTTYVQAIEDGSCTVRGRRGARRPVDAALLAARLAERSLRRRGVMYREPSWFVSAAESNFDLIHQHLFPVRQIGSRLPVVSSAGYPLSVLYGARERWPPWRLAVATRLEGLWCSAIGVHNPWLRGHQASVMTAYTTAALHFIHAHGHPTHLTRRISTGLPVPASGRPSTRSDGSPLRLLFLGRDFVLKGGPTALEAFEQLRGRHRVTLTVVSAQAPPPGLPPDVMWLGEVPHHLVLTQVLPQADVLVAPTRSDCGAPYAVLEALHRGIPVVLSTSQWLDDRLLPPAVARVDGSAAAVVSAVEQLMRPGMLEQAREAAESLARSTFSMSALGAELRAAYELALVSAASTGRPAAT